MKQKKPNKKTRIGTVITDKMQKTIVVRTQRTLQHFLYGKLQKKFVKFKVHDEKNQARVGDRVKIEEIRPVSKDKRWRLVEVLK